MGYALALQPDGRILVYASTGNDHVLLRLWQDATFDAGGKQAQGIDEAGFRPGSDEIASGIAVQPDNKIVLAGEVTNAAGTASDAFLARFLPDGRPDTSFGVQGVVTFGFGSFNGARAVALQPDDKIVAAGYIRSGSAVNFMVARFSPDGTPDSGFALVGTNVMDFAGGDDYGNAVALAPDGKIVVAGTVFNGARNVFGIARFNGNGTPDNTFDADAKQLIEFAAGPVHVATSVVAQSDRKIVLGGTFAGNFALARLNENGSVDGTFGLSGLMQTDMGGNDNLNALTLTSNGWFYAAGIRDVSGTRDFALAQYKPNGTLAGCPPFLCSVWPTGKAFADLGGDDAAFAVDWRSDGNVMAAGCSDGQFAWAQFRANSTSSPLTGKADFAGDECALGAKYYGYNRVVLGGRQTFNGDANAALARFETTLVPNTLRFMFLPLIAR